MSQSLCYYTFAMSDEQNTQTKTHSEKEEKVKFICPNDGEISQDDVVFLCNHCRQDDLIYKDGMYMCPACLMPGENFECILCESKEVKMVVEHEREGKEEKKTTVQD